MRGATNAVSGTVLPELSNPAGAANIQSGYQAINGEGVTGTANTPEYVRGEFLDSEGYYSGNIWGTGPDGLIEGQSFTRGDTISIQKNSVIVIKYCTNASTNGGISLIESTENSNGVPFDFFVVTGDFSITY